MKKALLVIAFALGLAAGWLIAWLRLQSASRTTDPKAPPIAAILKSAPVTLLPGNDHCEARLGNSVAEVLGGILDAGLDDTRNPYSYSCRGGTCRFQISNCMPWQDTDCGATMLEFGLDDHGAPRPESFACLDVP